MAGDVRRPYAAAGTDFSDMAALLHSQTVPCSSQPLDAFFLSGSSPSFNMGSRSMVSFEDVCGGKRSDRFCFRTFDQDEIGDDDLDDLFHQPEKKRRLTAEQVQFLERSFEAENKLEPERKIQLAKDLGLQPRQVAIWFQNRRARWKTKQLEKDFDTLQASYNNLKAEYDTLVQEKEKLKDEVLQLTDKLHLKEKEQGVLERSNTHCLFETTTTTTTINPTCSEPIVDCGSEVDAPLVSVFLLKKEELSSGKSDALDCDSPCCVGGGNTCFAEPCELFEPDQSDLSQDEEDNLSKSLIPSYYYVLPKIKDANYPEDSNYPEPPAYTCSPAGLLVEDQATWFWSFYGIKSPGEL